MLQELATGSNASAWAIGSLLFFIAVYAFVVVRTWRARPEDLAARARMALDDGEGSEKG
jgi:cbb3-type cytochrome oxidase subunit 3